MTKDIPAFLLTAMIVLGVFHFVHSVASRWCERKPLFSAYENMFVNPLFGVAMICYAIHSLSAEEIIVLPKTWERVLIYVPLGLAVYAHFRYRNSETPQHGGTRAEEEAGVK
jgi:hypothetical protein